MLGVTRDNLITSVICCKWLILGRESHLASARDAYTCLAIKWGDVRYYFSITVQLSRKCTQPCIVLEKSSPFSQQQPDTVCLLRSATSRWRARARVYTHLRSSRLHICTKTGMHFGRVPHVKVCRRECVFMQLRPICWWDDGVFI